MSEEDRDTSISTAKLYDQLKRSVAKDARQARLEFIRIFEDSSAKTDELLDAFGGPGDNRLRQMVADSMRDRSDKGRVVGHLARWLDKETDYFTKKAIQAALSGQEAATRTEGRRSPDVLLDTYRYLEERLCHDLRNKLLGPRRIVRQLKRMEEDSREVNLLAERSLLLADLEQELAGISRLTQMDIGDGHFDMGAMNLGVWVRAVHGEYVKVFHPIKLEVRDASRVGTLKASPFLLHRIFWNLLTNAHQAIGNSCEITVTIKTEKRELLAIVSDNGPGLPEEFLQDAFSRPVSSNAGARGRGFLEVADAVEQLHGRVQAMNLKGAIRILMSFPEVG